MPTKTVTVPFEITGWEQTTYSEAGGVEAGQALVSKSFSGDFTGTSTARVLLITVNGEGIAYTAQELLTGRLDGREGTFAVQHGAVSDQDSEQAPGRIVPGTGTGELAGIRGSATYQHDEQGARITLEYELD